MSDHETSEHCVFAYGSNMDRADLASWFERRGLVAPVVHRTQVGELSGHRVRFNFYAESRGGGAANVEPCTASPAPREPSSVHGLLLWVDLATLRGLDAKEGYPERYDRRRVNVRRGREGPVEAWLYYVTEAFRLDRHVPPSAYYLGLIESAAERHGFPASYRRWLRGFRVSPRA